MFKKQSTPPRLFGDCWGAHWPRSVWLNFRQFLPSMVEVGILAANIPKQFSQESSSTESDHKKSTQNTRLYINSTYIYICTVDTKVLSNTFKYTTP